MLKHIIIALLAGAALIGCSGTGEAEPNRNLEEVQQQPPADLEAGAKAQTMDEWAAANPNNGLPGHGDSNDK